MPNYRGIKVLQYECDLLTAHIQAEEMEISTLVSLKDLYSEEVYNSLIEAHRSFIDSYEAKRKEYSDILSEFLSLHTPSESCVSDDPLEYLYQEFLKVNLPIILKKIKNAYTNEVDSILSSETVLFSATAKKVAKYNLYHHTVDSIVSDLLYKKEIEELRSLPCYIPNASAAIQQKYEYYGDRLQCCLEIGNNIKNL